MEGEVYVSCHAPSLSLLLFETVRSTHDQKGLLIGEICKEIITEKTDDNEKSKEQRTNIYLEHCIPIKDNDFFGNVGSINKAKLQKYIDQYCDKIVGWYSFRRSTKVSSRTLGEILTHKSLIQSLKPARPDHFIAAFMTSTIGASLSTHIYNHIFMRFNSENSGFEPVKFKIYTMSDKAKSVNGYALKNIFPKCKNFESIVNPAEEESTPVLTVMSINKAISEYLKDVSEKFGESERTRIELEEEIINLRKCLSLEELENEKKIKVRQLEDEPEVAEIHYVRFDPSVNYNPNRKENPLKILELNNSSTMSEESIGVQNKNDLIELNNIHSDTPHSKNSKMINHDERFRMPENSGSHLSKIERNSTDGRKVNCSGDGDDKQLLQNTADLKSKENEKPVKLFEENDVGGL